MSKGKDVQKMKEKLNISDFFGSFNPPLFYNTYIEVSIDERNRTTLTKNAAIAYMMKNLSTQRAAIWTIVNLNTVKDAASKLKEKFKVDDNEFNNLEIVL